MNIEDPPGFSKSTLILIYMSAAIVWICIIAGIIILIVKQENIMNIIRWYVSKSIHVATPDRELLRDIYNRIKRSQDNGTIITRDDRREAYTIALDQHHANQELYQSVMRGS